MGIPLFGNNVHSNQIKAIWQLSRGEICVANLKANGASLDRFLNGPFVKMGCCQITQNGPILKFLG